MTIDHARMQQVVDAYMDAWNSGSPEVVAQFYAPDGGIVINRGRPWEGRAGVAEMAAGFFTSVPDMRITCDALRTADDHAVYFWTYTGTDAATGQPVRVSGWEEWDVDEDLKIKSSLGWYATAQ